VTGSHNLLLEFWDPFYMFGIVGHSISRERLKLETANLACRLTTKRTANKKLITRWDSERELLTTTAYTYYKIQNLLSNEAEVYQNFYHGKIRFAVKFENNNDKVMLECDRLCITHAFSVTSANIAINSISIKIDSLGYIFAAGSVGVSSTTFR